MSRRATRASPERSGGARARIQATRKAGERAAERATHLPGAPAVIQSFEREQRSGAALLAGGLAYRFFFWLVAFGLLNAAVASFWVRSSEQSAVNAAKSFGLSGVAANSAAHAVDNGSHARWYLLASGLVLVVYFGVGAVRALRVASFIAWQIKPTRIQRPLSASATFNGVTILGLGSTLATSWAREHAPGVGLLVTCCSLLVFIGVTLLAFRLLPHAEDTGWRALIPGALLVGAGIAAIHLFTVYYLAAKLERSPKLYGTLGAATVVLLGLYLMARVLLSAMFLNATLHWRAQGSSDRGEAQRVRPVDALRTGFERERHDG